MITFLDQKYLDPLEVAKVLSITTRTLNRWATDPDGSPERARDLAPITLINGRRAYPAKNVLIILKEIFGKDLTLPELEAMLSPAEEKSEDSSDPAPRRRPKFGVTTSRAHRRSRAVPLRSKRAGAHKQERARSAQGYFSPQTEIVG